VSKERGREIKKRGFASLGLSLLGWWVGIDKKGVGLEIIFKLYPRGVGHRSS